MANLGASSNAAAQGTLVQEVNSSFPLVKPAEILQVLAELGLTITEHDIAKPTLAITTKTFMAFLDSLSGCNQEWIEERAKMVNQLDYREIFPDGLYWRIFYRELNELFIASQLRDFAFSDITRPQSKRFKRQLSALINFWRFKSDRLQEFDNFANEEVEREARRNELLRVAQLKRARIEDIRAQREAERDSVLMLRKQNQASAETLKALKEEQSKRLNHMETLKKEKQDLLQKQTDLQYQIQLTVTDIRKLNGRIISSPKKLKGDLEHMSQQLLSCKADLDGEEKRARSLESKRDVMIALETELQACVSLLETLENEKNRIVEERRARDRTLEVIEQYRTQIRDADTILSQLRRQIQSATERLQRLKRGFDEKRSAYASKLQVTSASLNDLNRRKTEMMEEAKAKNRETAELEAEFDKLQEEYELFCNERMQERNTICHLAEVYIIGISRARDIEIDA
ncbi:kinetochore-associated Ndc80 complex subunit nuf2 [Tilletia horrida]|uniref:Kinetochore-associated Ndc80 complex subunit nuf2 n=1 Tax=Tilletia horrida TaxID=155126 RepID=A0AAN6JTW5_9BASI|nr:kinetochore-associated Ndc80 complex subunit nuf2 [Tilletia horrida]KAK0569883.1 kinetochore-associated Ndc80 complex subunit nuf2 [Tilletia horrida]